jgi:hypothetical protein
MRKTLPASLAGLALVGATAGVLAPTAMAENTPAAPPSCVKVTPDTVHAGDVVQIEAFCANGDKVEWVGSDVFPNGVGGQNPTPDLFRGEAEVGAVAPGMYSVQADCASGGMTSEAIVVE